MPEIRSERKIYREVEVRYGASILRVVHLEGMSGITDVRIEYGGSAVEIPGHIFERLATEQFRAVLFGS